MQLSKNDFQQTGRKEDGVTGNQDPTKAAAKEKGDGSKHFLEEIFNILQQRKNGMEVTISLKGSSTKKISIA